MANSQSWLFPAIIFMPDDSFMLQHWKQCLGAMIWLLGRPGDGFLAPAIGFANLGSF